MPALAYVGLGSNIAAEANLRTAVRQLAGHANLRLHGVSAVYRTPPWGPVPQDDFLNAAAALESALPPPALLDALQAIEALCGRDRTPAAVRWGPRTLDLDLLLYGDVVLESERLTLPHPRLAERAFALLPLCDLAPAVRHPVLGRPLRELLAAVDATGIVRTEVVLEGARPPGAQA